MLVEIKDFSKEKVREHWTKRQRKRKEIRKKKEREKEQETAAFQGHVLISFCWAPHFR